MTFYADETRSRAVLGCKARSVLDLGAGVADIPFQSIHFDLVAADGRPLLSVERQATVRDRYTVRVPHPEVDFRVAAAVAVGLDALLQR